MKKRVSFSFFCPNNKIADTLSFRKRGQREICQNKLLKFIKKHKNYLNLLVMHMDLMGSKKDSGGKRMRIYLYQSEDYAEEFAFMENLLWFYEFRQLFGNVFYGLPYKFPSILDPIHEEESTTKQAQIAPVLFISAALDQEDTVLYAVLDEFIKDIDSILTSTVTIENAKFDWANITINSFPSCVQKDEDFKASLKQLHGHYPYLANSEGPR